MKKLAIWMLEAILLMLGCPWLTSSFVDVSGMAICILLFFIVNPLYAAVCGAAAGRQIKKLWPLPILTAGLYLAGAWLFLEMGELDFLLYAGSYLVIGLAAMLLSALSLRRR